MAEVLGVAAGAVGLAGFAFQIIDSASKIRDFCSNVKNAPKDLVVLLEEISLFSFLVADLAQGEQQLQQDVQAQSLTLTLTGQQQPTESQVAIIRATELCRQAAAELESLLTELGENFQKKGTRLVLASIKFALRRKQVTQGLQRLDRAKSLLSLAQQCLLQ